MLISMIQVAKRDCIEFMRVSETFLPDSSSFITAPNLVVFLFNVIENLRVRQQRRRSGKRNVIKQFCLVKFKVRRPKIIRALVL